MKILKEALVALLFALPCLAENRVVPVTFRPGTIGTVINDGIPRGESLTYVLKCGAGQKMRIALRSVESNAVFEVMAPDGTSLGSSTSKDSDEVWFGTTTQAGAYKVLVGTTRGGADITISMDVW